MTFEGYAELHMLEKGTHNYNVAEAAWKAGQASAEQRVKDKITALQLMTFERDELQDKCAELERERDKWRRYASKCEERENDLLVAVTALKAQAGEPDCVVVGLDHLTKSSNCISVIYPVGTKLYTTLSTPAAEPKGETK